MRPARLGASVTREAWAVSGAPREGRKIHKFAWNRRRSEDDSDSASERLRSNIQQLYFEIFSAIL
eukprot:8835708-Pyramimonas_sp.AAC.1